MSGRGSNYYRVAVRRGVRSFLWKVLYFEAVLASGKEMTKRESFKAGRAEMKRLRAQEASSTIARFRVVNVTMGGKAFAEARNGTATAFLRPCRPYWMKRFVAHRPEFVEYRLAACRTEAVRHKVAVAAIEPCEACHGAGCGACGGRGQMIRVRTTPT